MENRISNIKNNLTAFENTAYTKKDVLTELLRLQDQMGNGLPKLKARKSKPRINDIRNYFKEWNANLKNVAATELREFEKLSAQFGNRVSAEISGSCARGRRSASEISVLGPNQWTPASSAQMVTMAITPTVLIFLFMASPP